MQKMKIPKVGIKKIKEKLVKRGYGVKRTACYQGCNRPIWLVENDKIKERWDYSQMLWWYWDLGEIPDAKWPSFKIA